ncbi:DNA cytosine methyltransferase [Spirulina sp. CS-785/01]|uniref:DNA cytosine methyltransferase n=1 Tax=Spirulina sp. CS-785/01 TaxID=3021716 RepID=UPI00232CECCE|nr:DNA cytosine methyltransferase [Spirulina sp. CS-785/01]MDB9315639.1 DNA cytosine methyltransferase [Spirulina sp. CS-785/01]
MIVRLRGDRTPHERVTGQVMLKQLDLCSGVGAGFPLAGLLTGGFELIELCEGDKWCRNILKRRYPGIPITKDIKGTNQAGLSYWECDGEHHQADIITASPPCQPFSIQGKRLGAADERDCLPAVLCAIRAIRPKYFCIENVPGLLSCPFQPGLPKGSYWQILTSAIAELDYRLTTLKLGSGHFAAPFRRERLLLVGLSHRVKPPPGTASWSEQARTQIEAIRNTQARRGLKPGFPERFLQSPEELPRFLGLPNGSTTVRRQREAIGNLLDPRVAALALQRVLYLETVTGGQNPN